MKKYDLYVTDLKGDEDSEFKKLSELSGQGWELISVVGLPMCRRAYFKREKQEKKFPIDETLPEMC
jgi:hypothetical protein